MLELDVGLLEVFFFGIFAGYLLCGVLILMARSLARRMREDLEKELDSGFRRNYGEEIEPGKRRSGDGENRGKEHKESDVRG